MVWSISPVESLPGEKMYYLFSKGTYKVGRKGCDVIINTDKGVSRIHAEIIIDSMTSLDPLQRRSTNFSSNVRIKDCSKYGTFVNKKSGTKTKVSENPNKESPLKDGDLLSFGTGNATYRFGFVPLVFYIYNVRANRMDRSLQEDISLIGARATHSWSAECTHVLVNESMPIKEDLLDAIVAQKPVVLKSWLKVIAETQILSEIPSSDNFVPTLTLEGLPVKIVDPKVRENCIAGFKFLLLSLDLYKFGERLPSLVGLGGAKVLSVDEFCSSGEMSEDGANNSVVLVNPPGSVNQLNNFQQLHLLSRINEMSLVLAILSGHLDQSMMETPSNVHSAVVVSSSCSTDETIVEDSDVEMDTVASPPAVQSSKLEENIKDKGEEKIPGENLCIKPDKIEPAKVEDGGMVGRRVDVNISETSLDHSSDIIYSQNLIVRDTKTAASVPPTNTQLINFKCFRKREAPCGNSFKNLVPYAKNPYRESDYGNEEVAEHVKEEKKRKQLEAIAEDLFNSDKVKRRKAADSSLRGIMTHG